MDAAATENRSVELDLNETLTRMKRLRDEYRHLDAEAKALKESYRDLEQQVIQHLSDAEMTKAGNDVAVVSLSEEDVPSVDPERWEDVRSYLIVNGYTDCLPKKLNAAPVRELWAMGINIPHVQPFTKKKLSLTSVK